MPPTQIRDLGRELVLIPRTRGSVLLMRSNACVGFAALVAFLLSQRQRPGHGPAPWLPLIFIVPTSALAWWASRRPIMTIHERGVVVMSGRVILAMRWEEARVGFASSVAHRILIRPVGGAADRSIISVDIPPALMGPVAAALPKSETVLGEEEGPDRSFETPALPAALRALT